MSTLTVTKTRHIRPRRLSLIASQQSPLLSLPFELAHSIFEHAILHCKPKDLALVSRAFCKVVDVILYRTVVLDSFNTICLFHRTTCSKTPSFLIDHVKRIVVNWEPDSNAACIRIHQIIAICSGMRFLVIPSCRWSVNFSLVGRNTVESGLTAITMRSFDGENTAESQALYPQTLDLSKALTHLRFCEPSDTWHSPIAMLTSFGSLPHLSHLQLARRANANEANDIMFAQDICQILRTRPALKQLVISIFPSLASFGTGSIVDSDIWNRMCEIRDEDHRMVILLGHREEWKAGWKDIKVLRSGCYPVDFWMGVATAKIPF